MVLVHHLIAMTAPYCARDGNRRTCFSTWTMSTIRCGLRYALSPPIWPGKLAHVARHVPALLAAERRGIALSRQTFVCSAGDQEALRRWSPGGKITVVPNALPVPAVATKPAGAPNLLFLGACEYPPNIEAAERLVKAIFPIIRKAVPEARLVIAGGGSERLPSRNQLPANVDYLGYVPDLDALYANARIVCCPLANGGGTRIKLIEAAAYGRPMVSSRVGAEGLDFAEGSEILLRDSDADFAQACIGLLQDEQACARLGAGGQDLACGTPMMPAKLSDQVRRT